MNYTKGEWKSREERDGLCAEIIENDKGVSVAMVLSLDDSMKPLPPSEVKANAHLIAAAPELLEACEYAMLKLAVVAGDKLLKGSEWIEFSNKAKRALAKAKGKEVS